MKERKKSIAELQLRLTEYQRELECVSADLGRFILTRPEIGVGAESLVFEYRRLQRDIEHSEQSIRDLIGDKDRLEANLRAQRLAEKNLESLQRGGELPLAAVGEVILNSDSQLSLGMEAFLQRATQVVNKIKEAEKALLTLDAESDDDKALARLGRSAKKAVLRSTINSRQADLRRIYAECGQAYVTRQDFPAQEPVSELITPQTQTAWTQLRSHLNSLESQTEALDELKSQEIELRALLAQQTGDGNIRRSLLRLENKLAEDHRRLNALYLEAGQQAYPVTDSQTSSVTAPVLTDELPKFGESALLSAKIKAFRESIDSVQYQIARIEASVLTDKAEAELRQLEQTLAEINRRIDQGQRDRADCEQQIASKQAELVELRHRQEP